MESKKATCGQTKERADIGQLVVALDSLVLNGIQFGVFTGLAGKDFVEGLSGRCASELDALDERVRDDTDPNRSQELAADLRAGIRRIADSIIRLQAFRSMPLPELRSAVAQIAPLRDQYAVRIQDLGRRLTGKSALAPVEPVARHDFFANLETIFEEMWKSSQLKPTKSCV